MTKKLLKFATSVALLGLALWILDWDGLAGALTSLTPSLLALSAVVALGQYAAMGLRWHVLVRSAMKVSLRESLAHYCYGTMLNMFTPANIGGDVYRFFSFGGRGGRSGMKIVTPLVRERILGLLSFFVAFLVCVSGLLLLRVEALRSSGPIFLAAAVLSISGVVAFVAAPGLLGVVSRWRFLRGHDAISRGLGRAREVFRFQSWFEFIFLMGLSLAAIVAWVGAVKIIAGDIGMEVSWLVLGAVAVGVEVVRLIPISIQGIGVRESAFAYSLGIMGFSPENGFILGTVSYLVLNLAMAACGFIGWVALPRSGVRRKA